MPSPIADLAHIWLRELEPTLTRYVVFTFGVWLLLWVVLRPLLAARKIRPETPAPKQLATEFMFSLRSMVIFATVDRKSTRLNSSHVSESRMPSSA
mgnify:CR=1 FL=1